MMSIDLMNADLTAAVDSLVPRLFPQAQLVAGIWRVGSIHGEAGDSLAVWSKGHKRGQWYDFAAGEGSDMVGLVRASQGHRDWKETFEWIRNFTGRGAEMTAEERRRAEQRAEAEKARRAQDERAHRQKLIASAKRHYLTGIPIPGTPAERYLIGRNIHLSRLGRAPGALRYHAAMRCPETGQERPCMLAMMQSLAEPEVTIHRTFLEIHADGRVTKAAMREPKVAYSAYAGAWIPLARGASGLPIRKMPLGEWIAVTEGIEDGLTLAVAMPQQRIVAALSLSNIGNLQFPERCGGIYLCADNDVKEDAKRGFQRAREKLEARGFRTVEFRPPAPFKDFNEWGQALARRAA